MLRPRPAVLPKMAAAKIACQLCIMRPVTPNRSPLSAPRPEWVRRAGVGLVLLAAAAYSGAGARSTPIENFSLPDQQGKTRRLYAQKSAPAVVLIFTMTGCPIVQKSVPKIKALRDEFRSRGVVFWLVDSNPEDDRAAIRQEARDFGIDLPILMDRRQVVARALGATRTAEAVGVQTKSWTIFYRGAIDDQFGYGTEKPRASQAYLEHALNCLLAGKGIHPAQTDVRGCRIQFTAAHP
jgi:peroxiredoxin